MKNHTANKEVIVVCVTYYLILTLFLIASFFPNYRIWGFNHWAYYPVYVPLILFGAGALVPIILHLIIRFRKDKSAGEPDVQKRARSYIFISSLIIIIFGIAFYLLRARTHFLGDGYTLLALFKENSPLIYKTREIGETLAHIWLYSIFDETYRQAALMSYQIISILCGLIFVITGVIFSRLLFEHTVDRVLLVLGLCSGGYMLLYFGYVENYAMFVLSIMVYTFTGILIVFQRVKKWWLIPSLILTIFFHILGVTLIPSTIYLFLLHTKLSKTISNWDKKTKLMITMLFLIVTGFVFYYFYSYSLFFRFSIIPFTEDKFTAEGYTLFSLKHIIDYFNLLFLLMPGIIIVLAIFSSTALRNIIKQPEYKYLLILCISTLGAAFIFDPKLGMPKDWDLFSFVGIPLLITSFLLILNNRKIISNYIALSSIIITINFLLLIPRIAGQTVPDVAIRHYQNYINLDRIKNRNSGDILADYYNNIGDSIMAIYERKCWHKKFPEEQTLYDALILMTENKPVEAISLLEKTARLNPINWNVWTNLGTCYLSIGQYNQALTTLKIANGMNPYNAQTYNSIASCYYYLSNFKDAENWWLKTLKLDSTALAPLMGLTKLYKLLKNKQQYFKYFFLIASHSDAPLEFIVQSGKYYLQQAEYEKARAAYSRALSKGLDSAYVKQLQEKHPQLKQ